jgi:hypothetical protein
MVGWSASGAARRAPSPLGGDDHEQLLAASIRRLFASVEGDRGLHAPNYMLAGENIGKLSAFRHAAQIAPPRCPAFCVGGNGNRWSPLHVVAAWGWRQADDVWHR